MLHFGRFGNLLVAKTVPYRLPAKPRSPLKPGASCPTILGSSCFSLAGRYCSPRLSASASLIVSTITPWLKRRNLTQRLQLYAEQDSGGYSRCRVYNGGYWTISQAVIYLSLDLDADDVLSPPVGYDAFIKPDKFVPLKGDQLCWAVRAPTINPMKVDIFAKERQPFSPCSIRDDMIIIPSEEGWERQNFRVFLRRKNYSGALKIVSADTDARFFHFSIRTNDPQASIEIATVESSACKYRV